MADDTMLKGHDLFALLTVDEMDRVSAFSSVESFGAGEVIFKINQPASHFYVLMDGLVYLELPGELPEFSVPISKVENGELFGVSPLLRSTHYTSTARCMRDSRTLVVAAEPFREVLDANRVAGMDVITRIGRIYFKRYLDVIGRLRSVAG
jgi:CRP-like cAMP-binding protein